MEHREKILEIIEENKGLIQSYFLLWKQTKNKKRIKIIMTQIKC